jgi:putative peptide zinc metalloprotease protein
MLESLYSPLWYRVADLKPQLREHVRIHRHHYRGDRWYLLLDEASGNNHRLTPAAHFLVGRMDGKRSLDQLWEATLERLGDAAPTQDETLQLLGQLHDADILQCDVPPDSLEVFRRQERYTQRRWKQRLLTPLAVRVPLLDPERFLTRWLPLVRPLFTRGAFAIWLLLMLAALLLAGVHWAAITQDLIDRVLTPRNLLVLWLTYPLVKILHELGHAFATRFWGGEVHEMGIMFLVLIPVPYVDASAASGFADKHRRMLVDAAGMIVELTLAALALLVWLAVEPGIVSAIAYNVMLIGSVSTLFFNGNPLLRFDGYYLLADALEIPNLGTRANRYLGYLAQRYLFGVRDARSPVSGRGEGVWFTAYGIAAFGYRIFILCAILFYIAGKYFVIGVLLAIWGAGTQLLMPLIHGLRFLFGSPGLRQRRLRAAGVMLVAGGLLGWVLFIMPAPSWTRTQGVVWLPEKSRIRAGTDCFISRVLAAVNTRVTAGDPVIRCEDPLLSARQDLLEARLKELKALYAAKRGDDYLEAEGIRDEIATLEAELALIREQLADLTIRSPGAGRLVVPHAEDLGGSYVHEGDIVAFVMHDRTPDIRVVVTQNRIGLVRQHTRGVQIRPASHPGPAIPATIVREVPAATQHLPSPALGTAGGGTVNVDPNDASGTAVLENVFLFDLALSEPLETKYYGQRVHVRFEHDPEPLARQWQRSLHQLFMRQFGA